MGNGDVESSWGGEGLGGSRFKAIARERYERPSEKGGDGGGRVAPLRKDQLKMEYASHTSTPRLGNEM